MTHVMRQTRQAIRNPFLTPRRELTFVIVLLLISFFFRTHELAGLGLGLEHDEVAEWQIADGIRHGQHALFFQEAYGQEPLFLYLLAGSTALMGDNVIAIRFTSVFVAMLTLAAAYRLLRRMFSPLVALVALASMSIALWPVFWGRVGLRAMTLPLMLALGFDFLWVGLTAGFNRSSEESGMKHSLRRFIPPSLYPFIMAGIFFGLSAYTYLSSRALPILLFVFTIYLALFARNRMRGKWRGLYLSFIVAAVVALPLAVTLLLNPNLQFRVSEVSGPLDMALQGDSTELAGNIPLAMGMFTQQGDATVRDNWPNRPVFPEPIGQWLFIGGVVVALMGLRQPRYVLALLWIGVMLIPSIVTSGAPNFTRTLGALPMVFAMPGLAVEWLTIWPLRLLSMERAQSFSRILTPVFVIALIGVYGVNAVSTYDDFFDKWPRHPETQFVFQSDFAAIAKDIDASDVMDVSVGGLSNDSMDDASLYLLRNRKDVRVRWFDSGSPISSGGSVLLPHGPAGRTYLPTIVPLAPQLEKYFALRTAPLVSEHFRRYEIDQAYHGDPSIDKGLYFQDSAILLSANPSLPSSVAAGSTLEFESRWLAREPIVYPRRIFVHLVDPTTGKIIAQHDGLDAPTKFWRASDWISQRHVLSIPAGTPAGQYELRLGLYDPLTGQRILQSDTNHTVSPGDYVVLGKVQVTR